MTFGVYSLANANNPEERLTASKAFVALSLFNILRFPLIMIPNLVSQLVQVNRAWLFNCNVMEVNVIHYSQVSVSIKRLGKFLQLEELDPNEIEWTEKPSSS